jgi:ribosomal protein S18 acetylase RimI-like enzyme
VGGKTCKNHQDQLTGTGSLAVKKTIIRNLQKQDVPAVLEIQRSIIHREFDVRAHEVFQEQLNRPDRISFVAIIDDRVAGFILGEVKTGDFGLERSLWVVNFGVNSKYMGEGIGQSLAERLFDYCRSHEIHEVYSVVSWDAVDLLSFFKALGFDRSNLINLEKKL